MSNHFLKKDYKMLSYKKVNRNQINLLLDELVNIRHEIQKTCLVPKDKMSDLKKYYELDSLNKRENFVLMKIIELKGFFENTKN